MKLYKLLIDGKERGGRKHFYSYNPANKRPLAKFVSGTEKDVDDAVKSARKAWRSWAETPPPIRGQILLKASLILRKRKYELAHLMSQEMGKVLKEALGDVQEGIDMFEYIAGEGRRMFGHTVPSELKHKFCLSLRRPLGVVGLITPWNFPVAIPSWKLAPALLCGNTVVFKPSSDTPLLAYKLLEVLHEAGLPKNIVQMVTGSGKDVGTSLVRHRDVQGISFTGSRSTGEFIRRNAGLKKVGLELGGKNAIIVMDDADLSLATEGIIWGAFGTTGQRCTAASRVIVHKKVKDKLLRKLVSMTKKLKLGQGINKKTDVGPLINKGALEKVKAYVEIGKEEGAKLLAGGKTGSSRGYFYSPTIFSDVKPDMRIAQEEIFGPVVSILEISSLRDAIRVANNVEYGLSTAIYTQKIKESFEAIEWLESGITYINSSTIGAEIQLPFGGVKNTGHGREAGWTALEEFSEEKAVYIDYSGKLQKAQGID
jgi:alpha-ketoglutaric semialdehyde dehydrogenase